MEKMTLEEAEQLIEKLRSEIQILHNEVDEASYYVGNLEEEIRTKGIWLGVLSIAFVLTLVSLLVIVV